MKRLGLYALILLLMACGKQTSSVATQIQSSEQRAEAIPFCVDSAYSFIETQVSFGARVPGSVAHRECKEWLAEKLGQYGFAVEIQEGVKLNYVGEEQKVYNVIGRRMDTEKQKHGEMLLLCAHYDSRPWADAEKDEQKRMTPVMGANDGASGVGVLLEIARQINLLTKQSIPNVEIVFFDVEDMGTPEFYDGLKRENTWCLGSQLWSERLKAGKSVVDGVALRSRDYKYGILLDMVGSGNAVFPKEYYSQQYAGIWQEKVWQTAEELGYGRYFVNEASYPLIDDHYYVNTISGVPCIDIIHYDKRGSGFPWYWHTVRDDMRNISKETLDAVGKVIISTICY